MTTRSIKPEELDACCALGGTQWLAAVVKRLWNQGTSADELCFVVEHEGRFMGRVFFHRRSSPTELAMFGIHIEPSADFFATGRELLDSALSHQRVKGVTAVD